MFKLVSLVLLFVCASASNALAQGKYPGIGRGATPAEIKAWDIDVRPDFKGLPKGSGSVAQGQQVWESKCASCHGVFGESTEVFTPIAGGVKKEDLRAGRAATLASEQPARTTVSKLSTISTLWDYIHRAMPWNNPKSLSVDEVYAVTAYVLNLGDILPADYVLSDANIGDVQKILPNRNGMTREHGLWDIRGKPDVKNVACMKDCTSEVTIQSQLPEHARDSHGNLQDQHRSIGALRGRRATDLAAKALSQRPAASPLKLAQQNACLSCHGLENRLIGPGFAEVAAKYGGYAGTEDELMKKLSAGTVGAWGQVPMPAQSHLAETELRAMVKWILKGAKD